MRQEHILVLDVGTTGVKAFVFDKYFKSLAKVYRKLNKFFPKKNMIEQDPFEIIVASRSVMRRVLKESRVPLKSFRGVGITNQRETTTIWNRRNGRPVYPAIVWEDERTKSYCRNLQKKFGEVIRVKTGLRADSYFSASKIRWILDNAAGTEKLSKFRDLAFGTVDSWLMWNFLADQPHVTDYTNASRTLLLNIRTLAWDEELLKIFDVPECLMPRLLPSQSLFGRLKKEIVGVSLPVFAVCGDQQASLFAAGTSRGTTKITYGTGIFIMQILGSRFGTCGKFFTTLTAGKQPCYALEAKIGDCGKKIQMTLNDEGELRKIIRRFAVRTDEFVKNLPLQPKKIIIDGGVTRYKGLQDIQSKISKLPVQTQKIFDGTALGVAKLVEESVRQNRIDKV